MKATVKSVQSSGTWEGHGKVFNIYEIQIGEHTGQYMSNKFMDKEASDFPFQVGKDCEYEYIAGDHPKIKLPKKEFNQSGGYNDGVDPMIKQAMIVKQNALGHATELLKHNSAYAKEPGIIKSDNVIQLAQKYADWVMKN